MHPKDVIFEFAHKYGIPYFLDTTPKWSNRGKLRFKLQPMLSDLFGTGYLESLSTLGHDSAEMLLLTYETVFQPVWESVQRTDVAVWFNFSNSRSRPRLFWKETLRHVFHSMNVNSIKDKTMEHFLWKLQGDTWCDGQGVWVPLKKELPTLLYGDYLVAFRPSFFVPLCSELSEELSRLTTIEENDADGDRSLFSTPKIIHCPLELDVSYTSGKWSLLVTAVPIEQLDSAPESSLWDVLKGSLTYYLRDAPSFQIDQRSRPAAFHTVPLAVTQRMPIVAPYPDFYHKDDCKRAIKVTLTYSCVYLSFHTLFTSSDPSIVANEEELQRTRGSNYQRALMIAGMSTSRKFVPRNQRVKKPRKQQNGPKKVQSDGEEEFGTGGLFE